MARADGWDPLYRQVGEVIAKARENADLSQNALAKRVNVSRTSIVNIEAGRQRPPIHLLWRIAEALEVSPGDLLPSPADLAEAAAPVQLDEMVIREIQAAAKDDPATERVFYGFVRQAKRIMARRGGPGSPPTPTDT